MLKRKVLLAMIMAVTMLISLMVPAKASTVSGMNVMVNNQRVVSNVPTAYSNGVVMIPAKEFASLLGGSFTYDSASMTGVIRQGENELSFRLDNSLAKFNGKYIQAPAPMQIINYRFMLPAEFVAGKLGAEVYTSLSKNLLMVFQSIEGKIIYQVMGGDSFWTISQLFGTSISTLKELNRLTSDVLYIGQKLIIKDFTPFVEVIAAQTTNNATLRSGAGFGFSPLAYVQAWTNISVVGKAGDWYKVTTPKGNGYMHYSIVGVKQDINDTAANSMYFSNSIPVDTSADFITYTSYTVQKGDTLWSISEKVGLPEYELRAANNLTSTSVLYIGQVLRVPVHNIPVKAKLAPQFGELLDWFKQAQYVFPIGKEAKLIDLETGRSFMVKRTMGGNHSDTETLTAADTQIMKEIFGGSWTWNRRSFILETDGRRLAVSVAGMPHAGIDGLPYLQNVSNRSDNWGYGPNYDRISGNGMDGHFDVYFLNSLRHKDNKMDSVHQYNVMVSSGLE
ncbi:MAG: LysM peptidoglycan-binding domain-containing protein [Clostridia bacterium]|nr:LysM peptidoglycan-binding domain-containing protein [Clostridia bacterium]